MNDNNDENPTTNEQSDAQSGAAPNDEIESRAGEGQAAPIQSTVFDLNQVVSDAKAVLTDPATFYKNLSARGAEQGIAEPAIFVAVMGAALGVVLAVFSIFGADRIGTMEAGFAALFMMPIMAVIGSFIGALLMFVIWKLMGSNGDYPTAYRCIAYATAIYPVMGVISLFPYLGTMVAVLWGMYLMYCATVHVHKIKEETARLVIGILAALSLFSQLYSEFAMRKLEKVMDRQIEQVEKASGALGTSLEGFLKESENLDEMTPEEAGRKIGEFFKGMNESMEGVEDGLENGSK